jgi:porphobilinogen synthase
MRQVEAGADIIGPAAMLDGAVSRIKEAIQAHANRPIPIMPNLTLRSCLYRTYRTEMRTGAGTQRQAFQIDPTRPEQYFSMGRQMAREGADLLMLQPGLFSLDLIAQMKAETSLPVGIYSVSGEFSMFRALSKNDEEFFDILIEHATASRRAGSDFIVTYAWREIAEGHSRYIA